MYAYCVREFSKKTAVSHDRAGSGSPLTAQAIIQSKSKIQKVTMYKNIIMSINMSKIERAALGLRPLGSSKNAK